MALDNPRKKEIMDLLVLSLEGAACEEDMVSLRKILYDSDEARDFYIEAVSVIDSIRKMESEQEDLEFEDDYRCALSREFWRILAEQERTAPTVDVPRELPDPKLIQQVFYPSRSKKQLSKFSLVTLISSAAALIFLMVFARFAPVEQVEVATLQDAINAKWGESDVKLVRGDRILSGSSHSLLGGGYVKLLFDNNAGVTIEGPAEFEVLSEDRIKLVYGQIYSTVPQEAIGFSVSTPNAMIIDLGTQFGIQVDFRGNTELHVNKGKTMLISGDKKGKVSNEVRAGAARKIASDTMDVTAIPCDEKGFVRQIDSDKNLIWRGELSLDLSDIFCGGNGLGTGNPEESINPVTGEIVVCKAEDREGDGRYIPIPERRFVDGVFVPNGSGKVIVSSENHVFSECPPTNNIFYFEPHKGIDEDRLNFVGSDDHPRPSLMLHANLGVTFDLNEFRAEYPVAEVTRFKSWFGIARNADREPNADVWVLVDGQVRFSHNDLREKGRPYSVEVDLKPSDRFLTLAVTESEDEDKVGVSRSTDSDWCIFVNPELVLCDK